MEERIACAVCHLKLSKVTNPDGRVWWGHPLKVQDHEAVPVEHQPKDIIYICDFCPSIRPRWVIPLTEHANTTKFDPSLGFSVTAIDTDAWWMACDICVELISAGDKKGLRNRSLAVLRKALPNFTQDEKDHVLLQLAAFWGAQPGPAVEASVLDDMEEEG